jgi:hypothetical protein
MDGIVLMYESYKKMILPLMKILDKVALMPMRRLLYETFEMQNL